jgi:hypothetical protein
MVVADVSANRVRQALVADGQVVGCGVASEQQTVQRRRSPRETADAVLLRCRTTTRAVVGDQQGLRPTLTAA